MTHEQIQEDFDRIALLSKDEWDHNNHYHRFLLKHVPSPCASALEIGCGTGAFTRLLAQLSEHVLALDLSPNMIEVAKIRSAQYANIEFLTADVMEWEFPREQFDCIVSIATLHHLPFADILTAIRGALKSNGVLIILDLFQAQGLSDMLTSLAAMPVSATLKLIRNGRLRDPHEIRAAWAKHAQHDIYLTFEQVCQNCAVVLPSSQVKKHLLWRYSIVMNMSIFHDLGGDHGMARSSQR